MIQIKPFTQIFKTEGDRTAFIKLLRDAHSPSDGRFIDTAMKTYAAGGPKSPSYIKEIKEHYSVIKDGVSDAKSDNLLENLAQSTGIDKMDVYVLYFRNLVARHSVENSSLLTDGITRMLSCKTADELNALGIEIFGDEWPASKSAHSTTHTLKSVDNCVNFVKFPGCGSKLPVFSVPIPYPELYDSVSEEDLPSYAADLTAAVALMGRMLIKERINGRDRENPLLINPVRVVKDAFDASIKMSKPDRVTLEAMEHLLFICFVEIRRAAATNNLTVSNPIFMEGLEQFMLKQGLGEEYLYLALRCRCRFNLDNSNHMLTALDVEPSKIKPFFSVAQPELKMDRDFMCRSLTDNKAFINNIMLPLLKGEYIKPCVVPCGILSESYDDSFDASFALLDIPSPKVRIGRNGILNVLSYLASHSDITEPENYCLGVYPSIYMGGVDTHSLNYFPAADDGKRCFRGVQSVGSLINNTAFGEDEIEEVGDNFESGSAVVDGLLTLLSLHRLCGDVTNDDDAILKSQEIIKVSTGKDATSIESSVMDGTARLALVVHAGKVYNLGTYLSAGVQISLIFQTPDYEGKYYLCVDTEEQKEIVNEIIQEALKNSDNPKEFRYLIHVCGKVTDPVWLPGGKLFGTSIIWSGNALPEELVSQTALFVLLTYKYVDSHYGTDESASLNALIGDAVWSHNNIGIFCACTMQDKQIEKYASDDFDMEEHFVVSTGGATLTRYSTITGNVMRRRGHCYLTAECPRLMPDGTLKVEIPNKGLYFLYLKDGLWGAFYISEGYMKMLYLQELVAYMPAITADYETISALPYQAKLRLVDSLPVACMEDDDDV